MGSLVGGEKVSRWVVVLVLRGLGGGVGFWVGVEICEVVV